MSPLTFAKHSRARTDAEFASKLGIVEQELDESMLWFELFVESAIVPHEKLASLHSEADELLRIVVTAIKKTRRK